MKFSLVYDQHKLPEWASKYIRYSFLLAVIKPLYAREEERTERVQSVKIPLMTFLSSGNSRASRAAMASINALGEEDFFYEQDLLTSWLLLLEQDCERVCAFYQEKIQEYVSELKDIKDYVSRHLKELDALLLLSDHQDPRYRVSSLQRAVESCHRHVWNLEVFLEVNVLAFRRLTHKLAKLSSEQPEFIKAFPVTMRGYERALGHIRKDIYMFAATNIMHTDLKHTKQQFRRAMSQYNTADVLMIGFCGGWAIVSLVMGVIALTTLNTLNPLVPSFCVYRLIACFMLLLWTGSAVLYVFDFYAINWPSVFEIRRKTALSFIKLMRTASVWSALLASFYMVHIVLVENADYYKADVVSLVAFIVFLLIWLAPVHFMHFKIRKELLAVLGNIFISPFGSVGFVHFFTADVLTTLSKPLADLYRSFCFVASGSWRTNSQDSCTGERYWIYFLIALPYVWRFLQCWNRFYYTRQWFPHLVNAGKYSMGILTVTISYFEPALSLSSSLTFYILVYFVATLYMLAWDMLMDFGFRRFFSVAGRSQRMYPLWMYFYVSGTNFLLRCTWSLTLMPKDWLVNQYLQVETLLLFICVLEIIRRGQWTLLRIENEKFSNIEKYRNEEFVPKMPKIIVDD